MRNDNTTDDNAGRTAEAGTAARSAFEGGCIRIRFYPYRWVRYPAVVLGLVGAVCGLSHHVRAVASALAFAKMPGELSCYLIVAGAVVLFGLSLLRETMDSELAADGPVSSRRGSGWRSI